MYAALMASVTAAAIGAPWIGFGAGFAESSLELIFAVSCQRPCYALTDAAIRQKQTHLIGSESRLYRTATPSCCQARATP